MNKKLGTVSCLNAQGQIASVPSEELSNNNSSVGIREQNRVPFMLSFAVS